MSEHQRDIQRGYITSWYPHRPRSIQMHSITERSVPRRVRRALPRPHSGHVRLAADRRCASLTRTPRWLFAIQTTSYLVHAEREQSRIRDTAGEAGDE